MSNQPTGYQRHPVEIGPLVFGLVFLGVVAAWGLFELGVVTGADTAWILPIVLIGAGALGVVLALTKPRRTEGREEARQAALAAYASQWGPAGDHDQTGTYADTAYTGNTGVYTDTSTEAPAAEVQDDTLDQTATTEVRADETDDTETYADTDNDSSTYPDPSTDQSFETDTREHRDD